MTIKTKEQIWQNKLAIEKKQNSNIEFRKDETIFSAMDEYARTDAISFCEWMQRYALYDYSKKPYRYTGRQHTNVGRGKPETWTAEELYNLYLLDQK